MSVLETIIVDRSANGASPITPKRIRPRQSGASIGMDGCHLHLETYAVLDSLAR